MARKLLLLMICLLSTISLSGCRNIINEANTLTQVSRILLNEVRESRPVEYKNFTTVDGLFQFTLPSDWIEESYKYDTLVGELRMLSPDQNFYFLVLTYSKIDLASHLTPEKVYQLQIQDMESKRGSWEELEPANTEALDGKTITSSLFSGEKEDSRNYYRFSLIQFTDNEDHFAVAIQIGTPSKWENQKQMLDAILASAEFLK